jgi:DNA-binding response OmpR family regulator
MKILVVEDDPTQLKLVTYVLTAAGHDVSGAEDAEQAFTAIKKDRPQLILLDLTLRGMDGLPLVRRLKADPDTRAIHVVTLTSYPEKYQKSAALAAGCDAYIVKPINVRELSSQLTAIVKGR